VLPAAAAIVFMAAAAIPPLTAFAAPAADAPAATRVAARSDNLLVVGVVSGDRMSIHVSRLADNAPVRDAPISVMLRGIVHATVVEPDGSYVFETKDLELPGAATLEFQVALPGSREVLKAEFAHSADQPGPGDKNGARQLWWWVLNFAVCIAFLRLWSSRRKAAAAREKIAGD
jgi:hypothetical protein